MRHTDSLGRSPATSRTAIVKLNMLQHATSPVVDGTLYLLILFSVVTWSVILTKLWQHWSCSRHNRTFDQSFWRAPDLASAAELSAPLSPKGRLLKAALHTLAETRSGTTHDLEHSGTHQEILERTLRQYIQRERSAIENGLTLLASIGSTAPFVGLFGTVWGIMHALQDISAKGSASLEVVAGPVGEALVATAAGIAVAIPAVLAYNFFLRRTKLFIADLEYFAVDFLHLSIKHDLQQGNKAHTNGTSN